MKKAFIIILFLIACFVVWHGCSNIGNTGMNYLPSDIQTEVIIIDGCEYVLFGGWHKGGITHKGNCVNHPMEKR